MSTTNPNRNLNSTSNPTNLLWRRSAIHAAIVGVAVFAWGFGVGLFWPEIRFQTNIDAFFAAADTDAIDRFLDGVMWQNLGTLFIYFIGLTAAAFKIEYGGFRHTLRVAGCLWAFNVSAGFLLGLATPTSAGKLMLQLLFLAVVGAGAVALVRQIIWVHKSTSETRDRFRESNSCSQE